GAPKSFMSAMAKPIATSAWAPSTSSRQRSASPSAGCASNRAVAKEVLERLQPLGMEAALAVIEARSQRRSEKKGQLDLALQQARYEAARAQRQYDAASGESLGGRRTGGALEQGARTRGGGRRQDRHP